MDKTAPELLIDALEHLQPEQRRMVLAWCLNRLGHLTVSPVAQVEREQLLAATPRATRAAQFDAARQWGALGAATGEGQQVVPVRFPTEQHARLRTWCQEHGFTMATVVRGLVGRFLEEQQAPGAGSDTTR